MSFHIKKIETGKIGEHFHILTFTVFFLCVHLKQIAFLQNYFIPKFNTWNKLLQYFFILNYLQYFTFYFFAYQVIYYTYTIITISNSTPTHRTNNYKYLKVNGLRICIHQRPSKDFYFYFFCLFKFIIWNSILLLRIHWILHILLLQLYAYVYSFFNNRIIYMRVIFV